MKQADIIRISGEKGVPKSTIDKDWVLGHFLNAMYSFEDVRKNFMFKGGTCLHKCYIKDYRFSQDLDFTLVDPNYLVDRTFVNQIIKVAQKNSIIKFHVSGLDLQQYNNIPQGYKVVIKFWGADHKANQRPLPPSRWQTDIHLDISFSEKLILAAVEKEIIHPYRDENLFQNTAMCYDYKELFAEKIRSLKQRNRPRDIYDVWYLSKSYPNPDLPELKALLFEKSKQKFLTINDAGDFVNNDKFISNKSAWEDSLGKQVSLDNIPSFDRIYEELTQFIVLLLNN